MAPLEMPAPIEGLPEADILAEAFANLASEAGCAILEVYDSDFAVRRKADASPVCAADEAAEAIIIKGLQRLLPQVPIIAEEQAAHGSVPAIGERPFLLVDPLDGTAEFIERNGEFTVNIALIANAVPIAGVVYAPIDGTLYLGGKAARRAILPPGNRFDPAAAVTIKARKVSERPVVVVSRSHCCEKTKDWAKAHNAAAVTSRGSALKFGLIAEGIADLYPRFTPTMEWDTAAGHALINAAGGSITTADGEPFLYGKAREGFRNGPFIARGA